MPTSTQTDPLDLAVYGNDPVWVGEWLNDTEVRCIIRTDGRLPNTSSTRITIHERTRYRRVRYGTPEWDTLNARIMVMRLVGDAQ